MQKVIFYFKKLFSLSYSESRAFVSLLIVCFLALCLIFFATFALKIQPRSSQADIQKLDSLVLLLEVGKTDIRYFKFNPNTLPADSLAMLGIPVKVAERLENYRSKGGVFRVKTDVKKVYGLNDELFLILATYIDLPDSIMKSPTKSQAIDINTANVNLLKMQPGIGDVFAGRIVKYRESLGGFVSLDQLDEVYGLEEKSLKSLKNKAYIGRDFVPRQVKVNSASVNALRSHPYISALLAEDIVRFRELNGAIESEKLLVSFKSIDKDKFERLILYLDFQ